ncbi:MAG: DNA-directed RNA polymerase [Candidatus Micrarchaeaceae archaeon]
MYKIYSVNDIFKLPPEEFGKDIEEVATRELAKKYESTIDKDMGIILLVFNVRNIGDGILYPADPATHHAVDFDVLTYTPQVEEIVAGEVSELAEFGAFVKIGPIDGLVHVSQIANEFLSFDRKATEFVSKKSNLSLKKGDFVYAKISTVSLKNTIKDSKIALTMRPEGLGKPEWSNLKQQESKRPIRHGGSGGGKLRQH